MNENQLHCPHCGAILVPEDYTNFGIMRGMYYDCELNNGKVTLIMPCYNCKHRVKFLGEITFNALASKYPEQNKSMKCPFCNSVVKPEDTKGTEYENESYLQPRNEFAEYFSWCLNCKNRITFFGDVKWFGILAF